MVDEQPEQGEATQRFQAFAESVDPAPGHTLPVALIIGAALLLGALVGALVLLLV